MDRNSHFDTFSQAIGAIGQASTPSSTHSRRHENVGMRCRDEIGTEHYNTGSGARISSRKKDKEKSYAFVIT
jgi:hypothetical protein